MEDKNLRKVSKKELLELLLEQAKKIEALEIELQETKEKLYSKEIMISEVGSLADASLKLNGIFEVAQEVADQYLFNIQKKCQELEDDTREKCREKEIEAEEYLTKVQQQLEHLNEKKEKIGNKNIDVGKKKKRTKSKLEKKSKKRNVKV